VTPNPSAGDVVGCDVGEREVAVAGTVLVAAVVDEGIHREDGNTDVICPQQRFDELRLVGRCDQDSIGASRDDRVEHRNLQGGVEVFCALKVDGDAQRLGGSLSPFVHGDVKGVGGQPGDQHDVEVVVLGEAHAQDETEDQRCDYGKFAHVTP
jgi:hypothetical protein